MFYCVYNVDYPIEYLNCGNLISKDRFLHMHRTADYYVFIMVIKGVLHITQNGIPYDIHENETILLLENTYHYGHQESEGELSYYWVHFKITDPDHKIYNRGSLKRVFLANNLPNLMLPQSDFNNMCILPELASVGEDKMSLIFFSQLLNMAIQDRYRKSIRVHHCLNLLLNQFSYENMADTLDQTTAMPKKLVNIMEWIALHHAEPITAASVSQEFNYHPSYLSSLFKEYTDKPLTDYINHYRIDVAKNLLVQYPHHPITRIAKRSGFHDEKYFMRIFKKYTSMTPTEYRNAFRLKPMNLI